MNSEVKMNDNRLQITRVFDAPRERVFAAWSRPEVLQQWTGCKESTNVECQMDFRVGGTFTTKMHIASAGGDCVIKGTYVEIVEPERISYDVNLGPATTRVVIEFIAQGKQTRMVLTQVGFPDKMIAGFVSKGTQESFDKLDQTLLASAHDSAGGS